MYWSGSEVKGQYAGRAFCARAALDEVTRIILSYWKAAILLSLPPGEGGFGQSPRTLLYRNVQSQGSNWCKRV